MSKETVWLIFREDCLTTETFINHKSCILFTTAQFCSLLAICLGLVVKLPQINVILKSSSVEGLEPMSLYTELLMHLNTLSSYLHLGMPPTLYASNLALVSLCSSVILLVWKFNKKITTKEKAIVGSFLVTYASILI